jgi:hypothetical protein
MGGRFLWEIDEVNNQIELPPGRAVYFIGGQRSLIRDITDYLEAITGIQDLGNCAAFGVHCVRTRHNLGHMTSNAAAAAKKASYAAKRKIFRRSTPVIQQTAVELKKYTILEVFPWYNPVIMGWGYQHARRIDVATPGRLTREELTAECNRTVLGKAFLPEYEGVFEI